MTLRPGVLLRGLSAAFVLQLGIVLISAAWPDTSRAQNLVDPNKVAPEYRDMLKRNTNLHKLLVNSPDMALAYAAKDARDFAHALEGQKGGYYAEVETRVLTDRQVTRENLIDGLDWLETAERPR